MVDLELRFDSHDVESSQTLSTDSAPASTLASGPMVLVEKAVANDVLVSSNDVLETHALLCATHDVEYHSRES